MEINVQVSDVDLTTVINPDSEDGIRPWTIADAVAYQMVERLRSDQELYPALRTRVSEIRDEEIREQIRPAIAEALTSPLTQTNMFGETTGKATTLREMILGEVQKQMKAPTERHGGKTVVQQIIADEVAKAFRSVVVAEVIAARAVVSEQIGKLVADAVKQGLRAR